MTKEELHKKFVSWLDSDFGRDCVGMHVRWIFCMVGGVGERDCDCVSNHNDGTEIEGCNCECHSRINEIIDFFWKQLVPDVENPGIDLTLITPTLPRGLQFIYDGKPLKLKSIPSPASSTLDDDEKALMADMINNPCGDDMDENDDEDE